MQDQTEGACTTPTSYEFAHVQRVATMSDIAEQIDADHMPTYCMKPIILNVVHESTPQMVRATQFFVQYKRRIDRTRDQR